MTTLSKRDKRGTGGINLEPILNSIVNDRYKGVPGGAEDGRLVDIHRRGWNLLREDLPLPVAVLRESSLEHNIAWMRRFAKTTGVQICPHGKTTMSPQLFDRQLAAGAWGITAATIGQVQIYRRFGVKRILLANQLLGPPAIDFVLRELEQDPTFDFYCLVDSVRSIDILAQAARRRGFTRVLQVLLETGELGGRSGARSLPDRLAVAEAVSRAAPYLALKGVEGFEGAIQTTADMTSVDQVNHILAEIVRTAEECARRALFAPGPIVLSAGGSAFVDLVTHTLRRARLGREVVVVLRSGCYIVHDSDWCDSFFRRMVQRASDIRDLGEGLRPALELWAYIQSLPEHGRAIATFGKRDSSYDTGYPRPTHWFRPGSHHRPQALSPDVKVVKMNDQHAYLDLEDNSPLAVGDMICLGISHPCTTLDKWQLLPVVNDNYDVVDAVRTFF